MQASTPANRAIHALRKRAQRTNDEYLEVVADEFEACYILMRRRGHQLQCLGLHLNNHISDTDRANARS